jgi:hypothetical protein
MTAEIGYNITDPGKGERVLPTAINEQAVRRCRERWSR